MIIKKVANLYSAFWNRVDKNYDNNEKKIYDYYLRDYSLACIRVKIVDIFDIIKYDISNY